MCGILVVGLLKILLKEPNLILYRDQMLLL